MEIGQIGIISVVAILNGLFLLGLSLAIQKICGIYNPGPVKNDTYECGMKSEMDSQVQFDIKYYLFAIMFVVFDVEFVFLMPWVSLFTFTEAGTRSFMIFEAFMFVAILLIGLLYAWKKGALDWNQEAI